MLEANQTFRVEMEGSEALHRIMQPLIADKFGGYRWFEVCSGAWVMWGNMSLADVPNALYDVALMGQVWQGRKPPRTTAEWDNGYRLLAFQDIAEIAIRQDRPGSCQLEFWITPEEKLRNIAHPGMRHAVSQLLGKLWRDDIIACFSRPASESHTAVPWDSTMLKLKALRRNRLEQLKDTGTIPKFTIACQQADHIDPKTVRTRDPELHRRWNDKEFREL